MFGIKDLFTTINLMGGVVAMCLCVDGEPFYAGVAVILGYLCGDTLDGYVARKLGTQNAFGAEFDTIADHTSHVIAPAVIVYTVYKKQSLLPEPWMNQGLALALAGSMIFFVSIRHARNIVAPVVGVKGVWVGLPRTVLGFAAIGYCNAALAPHAPLGMWLGVVLIPIMSAGTLSYLPFPSHHIIRGGQRGHVWYVNALIGTFFLSPVVMLFINRDFFFDVVFFWMAGYVMGGWMSLTPDERKAYFEHVKKGRAENLEREIAERATRTKVSKS